MQKKKAKHARLKYDSAVACNGFGHATHDGKTSRIKLKDIRNFPKADAIKHAEQGSYLLRHLWQNADDPYETLFLFKADYHGKAKEFIEKACMKAPKQEMTPKQICPK